MSKELTEAVIELREQDALQITDRLLAGGTDPLTIVNSCKEAMEVIGQRFACGEAFIPELDHGRRDHEGHHRQGEAPPRCTGRL